MKSAQIIPIVCFLFLIFTSAQFGCTSTKTSTETSPVKETEISYGYTNILQMLRKESHLRVTGPDSNPEIRVLGGGRSIAGSSEPLFVVDGLAVGRGYTSVSGIDVNQVRSISVISAARSGKYGSRGGNGVIEIKTK